MKCSGNLLFKESFINRIFIHRRMEPYKESKAQKIKRFLKETNRVLRITKKPNKEEFKTVVKITGLGAAVIGALGFIIFLIKQLLF